MASFIPTLVSLLFLLTPVTSQFTASCYICSGLNCAPHPNQLSLCKSSVTPAKVQCFFVAIDLDHIYRGCYEPNGTYLEFCSKHRMNLCRICRGQGCNNNAIFQDAPFSCRHCPLGQCHYTDEPDKINFRSCRPFFYGHVPRCLVYFYYGRLQYFFGCANAIPLAIRSSCEVDNFSSVCRFCDYPNCNDVYFAKFRMVLHYRFLCYQRTRYINCNVYTSHVPVMGCFFGGGSGDQGCFNQKTYKEYTEQVQKEHFRLCNEEQKCNNGNRDKFNYCAKSYDGVSTKISECALHWARCMITRWVDENDKMQEWRHCETREFCSHQDECFYCDHSRESGTACNQRQVDGSVYSCYYCDSMYGRCTTMNAATPNRTHLCTDPGRQCFTHLINDRVVRGCYFSNAKDSVQRECELDPENCEICKGALCNGKDTKMHCYICSAHNSLCQYDQMHHAISLCPGRDAIRTRMGCYTVVRPDGLVERGCWQKEFKCPSPDSQCISCETLGCNNGTYHTGKCLECSGPANGDCGQNVHYLASDDISQPCPVLIDLPLCYLAYKENNSMVERGCTGKNQYLAWMEPVCSRGMMNCTFCNENDCNYHVIDPWADEGRE